MRFEFGGRSKLNGRTIFIYPARVSYVPCSEEGLEEYIFAYDAQPLNLADFLANKDFLRIGDFLTPRKSGTPLEMGHIYPIPGDNDKAFAKTGRGGLVVTVNDGKYSKATLPIEKLALAIPGPETESELYTGAEVDVDPRGEVTLHYKELGVKVILETVEADNRFREENPELVAQNELFVINNEQIDL